DVPIRWRIGLPVGAERHQSDLILYLVDGLVVLGRARAIDAAEHPYEVSGRLVFPYAPRQVPGPAGSGNRVALRFGSRGALTRHLKHVCPPVEHGEERVATLHVRKT